MVDIVNETQKLVAEQPSKLRYLSVCSGIEAATVAWHPLGWEPVAFSEIEKFPAAVLQHHYPDTPNWGDMTKHKEWPDADVDVLVGGTPCQSFSVAGLRKGLDDPRGNLALTYLAIAAQYSPRWLVWENVPGVLSSNRGRDFGSFLGALGQLGYGFAYRVLDAQYYGLAQRRRRVFVVGYLGDWRRAGAVLFERESLSGHPAPSREARKDVAHTIAARTRGGGGIGTDFDRDGGLIAADMLSFGEYGPGETASTIKQRDYKDATDLVAHTLQTQCGSVTKDGTGRGTPIVPVDVAGTLKSCNQSGGWSNSADPAAAGYMLPVAFHPTQDPIHSDDGSTPALGCGSKGADRGMDVVAFSTMDSGKDATVGLSPTLRRKVIHGVADQWAVRRLTPTECERLQGFPDGYTAIPWRGKPADQCPDGPRYKALGNSMAVPVMRWIGERIQMVEDMQNG